MPRICITNKIKTGKSKLAAARQGANAGGFKGSFSFWSLTFKLSNGQAGFSAADFAVMKKYAQTSMGAMNSYCQAYDPKIIGVVESSTISLEISSPKGSFSDADLTSWIDSNAASAGINSNGTVAVVVPIQFGVITNTDATGAAGYHSVTPGGIPYIFLYVTPNPLHVADAAINFADVLSHEIEELLVDPQADLSMPEVCDPCTYNCENYEWLNTFDSKDNYLGSIKAGASWPKGTAYYISSAATPPEANKCPAPDKACAYKPPTTIISGTVMPGTSNVVPVTILSAAESATITPSSAVPGFILNPDGSVIMPPTGGLIHWGGVTNLPDGTVLHFQVNGVADPSVPDTTALSGAFAFDWIAPADTSPTAPILDSVAVTW